MTLTSLGLDTPRRVDPLAVDLKRLREERGWSQRELARRCGLGPSTITEAEGGVHGYSLYSLRAVAGAFDLEPVLAPKEVAGG